MSNTFGFPGSRDDAKSYEKMKEDFALLHVQTSAQAAAAAL